MKHLCLAVAAIIVSAAAAPAADLSTRSRVPRQEAPLPVAYLYNWTGCYIGGYAGAAKGGRDTATDLGGYNATGDRWRYDTGSSVIGGGTIGCNYQIASYVLGIENEIGYINIKGSALDPLSPFLPLDTASHVRVGHWYDVIAGRAGYAWDNTLIYVKAGAAITRVNYGVVDASAAGTGTNLISAVTTSTKASLAIGGGVEYALAGPLRIKAEYLYMDVRAKDNTCGNAVFGGAAFCWSHDFRGVHTGKVGLNYAFGPGAFLPGM
jgi:outer membrane immunogenic protein